MIAIIDNSKVKIHVYDWNAHTDSAKTLIGSCVTTLGELKAKQTKHADNPTVVPWPKNMDTLMYKNVDPISFARISVPLKQCTHT